MARQTGKTPNFGRLQEELFHTAQLLPPPPEKPYYTYEPPVYLNSDAYHQLLLGGMLSERKFDIPNLRERIREFPTPAKRPSMAEQLLGHLEIVECHPSEQRGRLIAVDHSTITPDTPAPVMFTEHGPL
jgi:hypothetical protein